MNNDLISRSALLKEMRVSGRAAYMIVQDAPAVDAVEVCRCKDCEHFYPYEGEEHKGDCDELVGLESCVYEDDFCSYGKRRVDE